MIKAKSRYILVLFIIYGFISSVQSYLNEKEEEENKLKIIIFRRQVCKDSKMCLSKWNYCGYGEDYCGDGCQSGPCIINKQYIITDKQFQCAFNNLDNQTRNKRLNALRQSNFKVINSDEAEVFLSHVYHETDGLSTLIEYCAPSNFYLLIKLKLLRELISLNRL
jgi:hypothetical protein